MEITKKWFVSINIIEKTTKPSAEPKRFTKLLASISLLKLSYQIGLVGSSMGWAASEVNFPGAGHM